MLLSRSFGLALASMLLCASFDSNAMSFDEAKKSADSHEHSLDRDDLSQLASSQGAVAAAAFRACFSFQGSGAIERFTIVMMLNSQGKVEKTWRKGDSLFAKCVEKHFVESQLFRPPSAPFFTSFAFSPR